MNVSSYMLEYNDLKKKYDINKTRLIQLIKESGPYMLIKYTTNGPEDFPLDIACFNNEEMAKSFVSNLKDLVFKNHKYTPEIEIKIWETPIKSYVDVTIDEIYLNVNLYDYEDVYEKYKEQFSREPYYGPF